MPVRRYRFVLAVSLIAISLMLTGCAQVAAQLAGTAIGLVLDATGITKKGDPSKVTKDLHIRIAAGEQLNASKSGAPLSLVTRIYVLRAVDRFKAMTYQQAANSELEKQALGDELISVKEIVLIPGKSYDITLKVTEESVNVGIVGLFRAPFQNRWKLAFENKLSFSEGITIGAHACAFSVSKGYLVGDVSSDVVKTLLGVQCNS